MILDLGTAATAAGDLVVLASSSDGDSSNLGLLFLLSGFVFYGLMFFRYRNAHRRHKHESETRSTMHDVRSVDQFVTSEKGLSSPTMAGANNKDVRGGGGLVRSLGL